MSPFSAVSICLMLALYNNQCASQACPEIIGRARWKAQQPRNQLQLRTPVSNVFVHHTNTARCNNLNSCTKVLQNIQKQHRAQGYPDIGYNFLIGGGAAGVGRVYEGTGWATRGSQNGPYNNRSISIAFIGTFHNNVPAEGMLSAARNLIDCGLQRNMILKKRKLHGHRDASCTACPGDALQNAIRSWPNFTPGKLPGYYCRR